MPRDVPANQSAPAKQAATGASDLLARIMDTPHLAHVVPRLHAEVIHRLILHCGLEDCGELVALVTPEQLTGMFDLDLWRGLPGTEERFDADRFGVWLEVLVQSGADDAARKVAEMDVGLVIAALAQHMLVVDPASAPSGEDDLPVGMLDDRFVLELGGYRIAPTRLDSWDAIAALLLALDAEHAEFFHRVMHGCRRLSNSSPEIDGLDNLMTDREQVLFDLALERERRREQQGFATPEQARAFLEMSRQIDPDHDTALGGNAIAIAYFREMDTPETGRTTRSDGQLSSDIPLAPEDSDSAITAVAADMIDVLAEAGVLVHPSRALLEGTTARTSRFALMRAHMQCVDERRDAVHSTRNQELAYLANTLLAGCGIQRRVLTMHEASEAAVAICNLGLENWPSKHTRHPLPEHFLVEHDLVRVFQVGWRVLYKEVCMHAAERMVDVLASLRVDDRHLQSDLDTLRAEMTAEWRRGTPWRAHAHLDVVAILDPLTWAALLGLTNECPVMHAAIDSSRGVGKTLSINPSSFDFISENSQIASIHEFMRSLEARLRG